MNYTGLAQCVSLFEQPTANSEQLKEKQPVLLNAQGETRQANISESLLLKNVMQRLAHNKCYICHTKTKQYHWFYSALCVPCGDYNFEMREAAVDMSGLVAVVTGARIKIGFNTALKLLRNGATVIATTRFVNDATTRYSKEPDFDMWKGKLMIYRLNLLDSLSITEFVEEISTFGRLDVLINNAAQTIYRPKWTSEDLLEGENGAPKVVRWESSEVKHENLKETLQHGLCCEGSTDGFKDDRHSNSWRLTLDKVSVEELKDVMTINAIAPFALITALLPLMCASEEKEIKLPEVARSDKFIVNVSSKEGQFYAKKSPFHPHTNMAKAALNMMTRTSAEDLAARNVFMSCVDPGWVSHESPVAMAESLDQQGCSPPLDCVDAAARICFPIFKGLTSKRKMYGQLLVHYEVADW